MNWLVIPTLLIALLLFVVGRKGMQRCRSLKGRTGFFMEISGAE
jgi:hypothetical protein